LIETLRIEDLAIVDAAELEFGPGLNVVTGETGAGKSIVLGAIALLSGGRASARLVREGADETRVEGVFRTARIPELEAILADRGLAGDDHELVVHRSLTVSGRSRARVSGQLVPVATLAELFDGRLEISSQHDSQSLRRADTHGRLLDRVGGLLPLREAVATRHRSLRDLDAERAALGLAARDRAARRDYLEFQLRELDEAKLDPAEIDELRRQRSRLAHAERLRADGAEALARLVGDPAADAAPAAADLLADAARGLAALARLDAELAAVGERLAGATAEVRDAAADLERLLDTIDADPARLAAIDERLHGVERLERKHAADVPELLRRRDALAAELAGIEGASAREAEIDGLRHGLVRRLAADAAKLGAGRAKASARLAQDVQAALRELAMPDARFAVELAPAPAEADYPCGPAGCELPEFMFSANAGEAPRPLRQIASGGELSRTLLAIKQALREEQAGMVLVFDEVDAGVSGEAADRVGRQLAQLAARHQVLCITHLPQIAAFAERHFRVWKERRGGRSVARLAAVEGADRVAEIARMAGGDRAGQGTRRYAEELLRTRAPQARR
jgi:DNA repair protein RecN (Recombination protein N)